MKYPKIQTLYERSKENFKVMPDKFRLPEFGLISQWLVTEKIDGTNIRVMMDEQGKVTFGGRTDRAQLYAPLVNMLTNTFTEEKMQTVFKPMDGEWPSVILFGEGYGIKIQKGGKYRSEGQSFRLFDIRIGNWWLNWVDVGNIAASLGILTVPTLQSIRYNPRSLGDLIELFDYGSIVSRQDKDETDVQPEGIVARTEPLLFTRRGDRVMWKLKFGDW